MMATHGNTMFPLLNEQISDNHSIGQAASWQPNNY